MHAIRDDMSAEFRTGTLPMPSLPGPMIADRSHSPKAARLAAPSLALFATLALAACGGSGSPPAALPPPPASQDQTPSGSEEQQTQPASPLQPETPQTRQTTDTPQTPQTRQTTDAPQTPRTRQSPETPVSRNTKPSLNTSLDWGAWAQAFGTTDFAFEFLPHDIVGNRVGLVYADAVATFTHLDLEHELSGSASFSGRALGIVNDGSSRWDGYLARTENVTAQVTWAPGGGWNPDVGGHNVDDSTMTITFGQFSLYASPDSSPAGTLRGRTFKDVESTQRTASHSGNGAVGWYQNVSVSNGALDSSVVRGFINDDGSLMYGDFEIGETGIVGWWGVNKD